MLDILDVIIGLVFVYLLLSLVCTAIVEFWAGMFRSRARTLATGISQLLNGGAGEAAASGAGFTGDMMKRFYGHELIQTISRRSVLRFLWRPDYIPARTFTLALLDILLPADGAPLAADAVALALRDAPIPEALRRNLLILLREAEGDMDRFRRAIETWFNNAMDRVSGWYKRKSQYVIFLVAVAVAVVTDADTLSIARTLASNSAVRAALVAQAEAMADLPFDSLAIPVRDSTGALLTKTEQRIEDRIDRLESLGVPLGWKTDGQHVTIRAWFGAASGPERAAKLVGLFLTALALSLGAPFWFDVLNKVINVRNAGRAPDERPKKPEGETREMRDSRAQDSTAG